MSLLAYLPPKSVSHGHGPRARSPRKAWAATQTFLNKHATAQLRSPLKLHVWGHDQFTDPVIVESTLAEANEAFGPPTSVSGIFNEWELPSSRLDDALEFAFADDKRPKQPLGPVGLYISYSFEWREMPNPNRSQLSAQFKSGNQIAVALGGRRAFILPVFKFSASDQDAEFIAKLRALEEAMPFAPKDDYYYRIEPKKSGDGEKLVKLHKGWKVAA